MGAPYLKLEATKMTKREAVKQFRTEILPRIPSNDKPARDQAWNDWTDGLCKDKQITQRQYDTWDHPFN